MTPHAKPLCATATVRAYEHLRRCCLEASPHLAVAPGLSVLLGQGMLAWARACVPTLKPQAPTPLPLETAPSVRHQDIIDVLVSMAMQCSRSAHIGAPPR
ncbi:hypothetical protein U5801_25430 [Lamprobacter modestohalophilus]|uniref:hypothetical protein n=1 Tax=Lamprobacter modestohalophilus TaxID=1064514 RepID=UPI002ADEAB1A|nr:hypothetical protein [Lamprobacter modestohalophilus]MEA1053124.1 hypothetical protein [Lamprobacter modestohalophilus]